MVTKTIKNQKQSLSIELRSDENWQYWKKFVWDAKQPLVMVIANYPAAKQLMIDDLTSLLIRNAIAERQTFGGVVVANLFNSNVKWASNKSLAEAAAPSGLAELVAISKKVDKVIIATGSLTTKHEAAMIRLADYLEQCKQAKLDKKLFWLLNSNGKKVHPLAIRDEAWKFGPVNTTNKEVTKE